MNLPTVQPLLHCYLLCHKPMLGAQTGRLGGLYTECTTTPDITIVISSTNSLYSFINVINLQVVSDKNSTTILVVETFSY